MSVSKSEKVWETELREILLIGDYDMEFKDVVTGREAVRKFSDKKPTEEQIDSILEAGRLAPTAYNKQPQRVYVLESNEALAKMDKVHPCRYGAPIVLLVCGDREVTPDLDGIPTAMVDATISATHMLLAAYDAGVDSVWAGVFKMEETKKIFDLPDSMIPVCFIDLGFRTADYKGNPQHNKRNPLEKMVKRI